MSATRFQFAGAVHGLKGHQCQIDGVVIENITYILQAVKGCGEY